MQLPSTVAILTIQSYNQTPKNRSDRCKNELFLSSFSQHLSYRSKRGQNPALTATRRTGPELIPIQVN